MEMYQGLHDHFGPQHWWPAETPTEMIIGAVLTQNTAWRNVEVALSVLRQQNLLTLSALHAVSENRLALFIRSSGFFNVKARRLKNLVGFIHETYGGSLDRMFAQAGKTLRAQLLSVSGIGPETADSILLYAGAFPIFVVDAYTRRIFLRHRLIDTSDGYASVQSFFMRRLPHRAPLFNEYHALIVRTAKVYCKREPACEVCPLGYLMSNAQRQFISSTHPARAASPASPASPARAAAGAAS